jgi:L-lactate permease
MSLVVKATVSMTVAIAGVVSMAVLGGTLADVIGGIVVLIAMLLFTRAIMKLAAEPGEEDQRSGR